MAADAPETTEVPTIQSCVEKAKRAFALRKYEEAVDLYATALELTTKQSGESAPETADLYYSYGKALLENAIAQAGVMGKEETEGALKGDDKASPSKGGRIHFSGDAEEEEEETVDLFGKEAKGSKDAEEEDEDEDGEGDDDEEDGAEPEDDFNAAWEVLDLARAIYIKEEGDDAKLKLADTYIALGDVSLETEKFDQAVDDYTEGLRLKNTLLPFESRQIAEAHYRLSMVLDLTPGRLASAIEHADLAHQSIVAKLKTLREALPNAPETAPAAALGETQTVDSKGKGKARAIIVDSVTGLTRSEVESQIKEFEELEKDLGQKVDDMKTSPDMSANHESAPVAANHALDVMLSGTTPKAASSAPVNDITSMVKKKKKPAAENVDATPASSTLAPAAPKRKVDEDDQGQDGAVTPVEKKAKLDDVDAN